MKISFLARGFCVGAVLCAGVLLSHAAQQPQNIAILPLTAGGQENINYIAEGLRDMIASRIASGAGLTVIEQAAVNRQYAGGGREALSPERVRSTGKALGADYVIFGSVAKMGDDLLIAVNMLSVAKGGAPFPVFSQTLGMNEVIPRLQLIAQEVRGAIEDGVLAPEEDVPSAGDRKETERLRPAEAPTAGRVGPDPLMERDEPEKPGAPADAPDSVQSGETEQEEAEEVETAGDKEEAADKQEDEKKGLGELLFKRRGDIKSPPENPVYEKSVDELQGAEKPQP
jgi:TolB-like protein